MAEIYQVTSDFEGVPSEVRRALLVADNGFFQLRRLVVHDQVLIEAVTRMGEGWPDDGLADHEEGLRLGFAEKIGWDRLQQTLAFFKVAYHRYHGEAIVLLFYAPMAPEGQRWRLVAPKQQVGGGRVVSQDPGPAPAGWYLAGDIHSHGGGSAFHSGTDNHDEENRDGIHITIGGVGGPTPSFSASVVVNGTRFRVDLSDLVEGFPQVDFPEEWMSRVSELPPPQPVQIAGQGDALATWRATQQTVRPARRGGKDGR